MPGIQPTTPRPARFAKPARSEKILIKDAKSLEAAREKWYRSIRPPC
jgi:hypothetical protein